MNVKLLFLLLMLVLIPLHSGLAQSGESTDLVDGIRSTLADTFAAAGYSGEQNIFDPRVIAVNIINAVLGVFGVAFTALLVYGGWLWMTAAGNQDHVDRAKKVLQWAVIGIAIVIVSLSIGVFVSNSLIEATGGVITE